MRRPAGPGYAWIALFKKTQQRADQRSRHGPCHPVGAIGTRIYAIRPYSPHVPRAIQALVPIFVKSMKEGFVQPD